MDFKVFYSWQSDSPNATNRGFIQAALERAAANITKDDTVAVEPVVDRDTQGLTGAPAIDQTIFEKIANSHAFVADISIINVGAPGRPTPNPNVLLELGFAACCLGWDRIVLVFNLESGDPANALPFDLRLRRRIEYRAQVGESNRSEAKRSLTSDFEFAARGMIDAEHAKNVAGAIPQAQAIDLAVKAIEDQTTSRILRVREYLDQLLTELDSLNPSWIPSNEVDEQLTAAIDKTPDVMCCFGKLCETIAIIGDTGAAREVHRFFERVIERFEVEAGYSGVIHDYQFDFWKFIGNELFVSFIAFLIYENRWNLIGELLALNFHNEGARLRGQSPVSSFIGFSSHVMLLDHRKTRLGLRWITLHGQLLSERHVPGGPVDCVPWDLYLQSDLFLYLRGEISHPLGDPWVSWVPWTAIYLKSIPRFVTAAQTPRIATELASALGATSIEAMKEKLRDRIPYLMKVWPGATMMGVTRDMKAVDRIGTQ